LQIQNAAVYVQYVLYFTPKYQPWEEYVREDWGQISERKGKIVGQRVVDAEGHLIETTVLTNGSFKGTPVKATITFVSRPTSAVGVLSGKGKGILMTEESGMATSTAEGSVRWRGAHLMRSSSIGKLEFLKNVGGVFEAEIDREGNLTEKIWEWK
jgi:hypothetical protein